MKRVSGQGYGRKLISYMYKRWKRRWSEANPGLNRAAAKIKMNEDMCDQIAEADRLAKSRKSASALASSRGRRRATAREKAKERRIFFAKKDVPRDWSLRRHLQTTIEFQHLVVSSNEVVQETIMATRDTHRLKPARWFNADIINAYMALLGGESNPSRGCLFMPCTFYTKFVTLKNDIPKKRHALVKRWTSKLNTTSKVKIFVPVNIKDLHWTLVMIDVENKKVFSMDSSGGNGKASRTAMLDWIEQEHAAKRVKFDRTKWVSEKKIVPSQINGYDCGLFICMFAAFMCNDKKLTFAQDDMPRMRNRLAWSIINSTLI